jgi:hypothetical protein
VLLEAGPTSKSLAASGLTQAQSQTLGGMESMFLMLLVIPVSGLMLNEFVVERDVSTLGFPLQILGH